MTRRNFFQALAAFVAGAFIRPEPLPTPVTEQVPLIEPLPGTPKRATGVTLEIKDLVTGKVYRPSTRSVSMNLESELLDVTSHYVGHYEWKAIKSRRGGTIRRRVYVPAQQVRQQHLARMQTNTVTLDTFYNHDDIGIREAVTRPFEMRLVGPDDLVGSINLTRRVKLLRVEMSANPNEALMAMWTFEDLGNDV